MTDLSLQYRLESVSGPSVESVSIGDANKQMYIERSDENALIARRINTAIPFLLGASEDKPFPWQKAESN